MSQRRRVLYALIARGPSGSEQEERQGHVEGV